MGELNCPCTQHKVLVTESVWEEKPMTKQVYTTHPAYRTNVQNCFSVVLLLTVPTPLWPSLNPPHNFQNQSSPVSLTFSCFSVSISQHFSLLLSHMQSSTIWSSWPDILHTHPHPEKSLGPHSIQTLPCACFFCVVAPTDVNPLFHKGSQLPFSLKARWLWHLPVSKTFNPT